MYYANTNVNLIVESEVKIKSGIAINVDQSPKNIIPVEKNYIWNHVTCRRESGKY